LIEICRSKNMSFDPRLVAAWSDVLRLSQLKAEETVVLLKGAIAYEANIVAAQAAVSAIGASLVLIEPMQRAPSCRRGSGKGEVGGLAANPSIIAALKSADLVLDMMGMDRGHEQFEVLAAGTRILLVKEPPETLMRLLPTEDDKRVVVEAARKLSSAKTMMVSSKAGTSLQMQIGEYPCLVQYGYADTPGHWDHWPGAFVATWPNEGTAEGRVVLSPGDVILPFKDYLRTPIELTIKAGYIISVDGEFDARYLRDYLARFEDPEAYAVSHLGWGLHRASHWTALGLTDKRDSNGMESRAFSGNFMFSTGPNSEAGGSRHTACHLDIPMMDCSVSIDGKAVTMDGGLVAIDQRAA
jgi:2,5-dihydroxypyridine 5,6-dioxygenase